MPFLHALYAELRADELAFVPWTDAAKATFVASQFALQHRHVATPGTTTDFWIVEIRRNPVGRLYVDRRQPLWRLVDIALAPAARGHGAGSALLDWLQRIARDADAAGIVLHVLVTNSRAAALYARHGFIPVEGGSETHRRMVWRVS
jgi:GNAT superfamily N-acetyltransferase